MDDSRWLKRLRRELAASGHRSQLAWLLAAQDGTPSADWGQRLLAITSGEIRLDPDLILRLESVLARRQAVPQASNQGLFAF